MSLYLKRLERGREVAYLKLLIARMNLKLLIAKMKRQRSGQSAERGR